MKAARYFLVLGLVAVALLSLIVSCGTETVEVPVEKVVTQEVVREVMVPGETVIVEKEVVREVMVPGETVVVEKKVVKTVEVPSEPVLIEK